MVNINDTDRLHFSTQTVAVGDRLLAILQRFEFPYVKYRNVIFLDLVVFGREIAQAEAGCIKYAWVQPLVKHNFLRAEPGI